MIHVNLHVYHVNPNMTIVLIRNRICHVYVAKATRLQIVWTVTKLFKPIEMSHSYQWDQSISVSRVLGWYFSLSFKF